MMGRSEGLDREMKRSCKAYKAGGSARELDANCRVSKSPPLRTVRPFHTARLISALYTLSRAGLFAI